MRGLYLQLSCLFPLVGSLPAQLPWTRWERGFGVVSLLC